MRAAVRGTSRNTYAIYSEAGPDYVYNMQRLLRKFETAKQYIPKPVERKAGKATRFGVLYYGSTSCAMDEAYDRLEEQGLHVDVMRVRAFPFHESVMEFIAAHDHVFVGAEQPGRVGEEVAQAGEGDDAPEGGVVLLGEDEGIARSPGGADGGSTSTTITAMGLAFDTNALSFPANTPVTLTLDNQDPGVPHNVAIYPSSTDLMTPLFRGDLDTGVATITYDIPALMPGTYYFHCDVHPTMNGTVTVA